MGQNSQSNFSSDKKQTEGGDTAVINHHFIEVSVTATHDVLISKPKEQDPAKGNTILQGLLDTCNKVNLSG